MDAIVEPEIAGSVPLKAVPRVEGLSKAEVLPEMKVPVRGMVPELEVYTDGTLPGIEVLLKVISPRLVVFAVPL